MASARILALAVLLGACGRGGSARPEVGLWAAASLRDALEELAPDLERASGAEVVLNLGSSTDLARQILAGAPADVFLSADPREVDRLEEAGLVLPGTRRELLENQLVVVAPAEGPPLEDVERIAGPEVRRLSLGDPRTVPAGRYARRWLESRGLWSAVSDRVLPAVDVRAALAAVESGSCEAGIVYRTDAARSERVRVVHVVPLEEGPPIRYEAAVLAGGPDAAAGRSLLGFLAGPAATEVFRRHGFVPLATGER